MTVPHRFIWLGASPKCFLNSREKVEGEEAPTLSATSLTVHSPDRSSYRAMFIR